MEVHPPEHPIHTWRDFLIHIATIVVGLLIAIGLEQTVVQVEHHHEVAETRERLHEERETNIAYYKKNLFFIRETVGELHGNVRILTYLKAHPGSTPDQLPGALYWTMSTRSIETSTWDWLQKAPVFEWFPREDIKRDRILYSLLKESDDKHNALFDCLTEAGDYQFVQPDISKLTPQQIDLALARTQTCFRITFQYEVMMNNIASNSPDFAPGPSSAELDALAGANPIAVAPNVAEWNAKDQDTARLWEKLDTQMKEIAEHISPNGDNIVQVYNKFQAKHEGFAPSETYLNSFGYQLLKEGSTPQAIAIFRLNVYQNPQSWNAYDSLGEALAKAGDTKNAIANYEKSVQLNPRSTSGIEALSKLKK